MKSLYAHYQDLKFQKKIMILCFIVSFIPIIVLGIFSMVQSSKLLVKQEESYLGDILESANSTIDHYLIVHENIITTLSWDESIQTAVDKKYTSNYEMFLANLEIFDSKFPLTKAMHPEIDSITLYTGTNLYPHGNTLNNLEALKDYPWYNLALKATTPFYVLDKSQNKLLLIYKVPSRIYDNVIIMTLSYDSTFNDYKNLFDDSYALGIYDSTGELLFEYSSLREQDISLFASTLSETLAIDYPSKYFRQYSSNNSHDWTIMVYRPEEYITSSAISFIFIIIAMIICCIGAIGIIALHLSKQLVEPLEELSYNMEQIQADNFTVTVEAKNEDEISHLIRSFDKMANRLEVTIDELYKNKLLKQEYRLSMLQSQINPHFLYNCLSLINSKAIRADQPEISKIALQLSSFYRTTLNKGHNFILLADEWKNTTSYIEIQKMLHSSSFQVEYDIDETLFNNRVINLLIQPLVENAILHGIDYKENTDLDPGKIFISIKRQDNLMLIKVIDNGCGMDEETLNSITTTETKGYGIHNVDQRIKLFFGDAYGISYESALGVGTTATITLPIQ